MICSYYLDSANHGPTLMEKNNCGVGSGHNGVIIYLAFNFKSQYMNLEFYLERFLISTR